MAASCSCLCRRVVIDEAGSVHLEKKGLRSIPSGAKGPRVKELWVQDNSIAGFPPELCCWENAELIYATNNELAYIEGKVAASWVSLQELNLSGNAALSKLPDESAAWVDLRQLYCNDLPLLTSLPDSSVRSWTRLKILHANSCSLDSLPEDIGHCTSLTMISLNNNKLQGLPASIANWSRVEKIFLNDNLLTELPPLEGMAALEKLNVNSNRLIALPVSIAVLPSLEASSPAQSTVCRSLPCVRGASFSLFVSIPGGIRHE